MTVEYKFPEGFWWGTATSGPQSEGAGDVDGKKMSIWDYWYKEEPERFFDNVGPQDTSTFYVNYKDDIKLLKETGHNSFRTSIQWSRLIPDGVGEVNPKAVEFYNNVIDELIASDVLPIINLFHFDMPLCMQEKGGWESREVVEAYAQFAKKCFELFGDRVKHWMTFNEPIVPVEGGYLYNFHYPKVQDGKRAAQVAFHTMLANAKAIKEYKELGQDGQIGIVLNLTPSYPRSTENEEDVKAAHIADLFFNRSFLDSAVLGEVPSELVELLKQYNVLPVYEDGDVELIKNNTVQYLGVNYYQPRRIKAKESEYKEDVFMPDMFFDNYEMPGRKMNPYRGWEIYEKGIYDICINIRDNYNNIPFYISENGMGVEGEEKYINAEGVVEDDYRIEFVKNHLRWLHKGIAEGANCKGYHLWTFIDCWSWTNAYKNRYGLIALDLETQKRTIKKSGRWFKEVADNNGF
ncbi:MULTISPECIES: glycoside hydrolase family 1 protein [Clostridia]|uniref:glycoside hydrolase family 1 protein n=1 Tax=Clostridia TaxID=186801 RepID=UPI0018AA1BD9|nr:glycoside hydrolase family 1 protein [Clostridium sp. 1001270J_160509_D11]